LKIITSSPGFSKAYFTGKNHNFYWNFWVILQDKKMFFTGQKIHEIFLNLPDKMIFFTGRFIHSHMQTTNYFQTP